MPAQSEINLSELDRELQITLGALGEIDRWYEAERSLLMNLPEAVRAGLTTDIERRHRQHREPYVQHIAEVYHKIMSVKLFNNAGRFIPT